MRSETKRVRKAAGPARRARVALARAFQGRRLGRGTAATLLVAALGGGLVAGGLLVGAGQGARADGAQSLPRVQLGVGDATLDTEIADDGQERYIGLGFRDEMPEDAAMLFVYPDERPLTFTMRDTRIPLSIAFLSEDLVINEIHDMPVGPDQLFPSERPAMYALETNLGWFERNGIEPGDVVRLP